MRFGILGKSKRATRALAFSLCLFGAPQVEVGHVAAQDLRTGKKEGEVLRKDDGTGLWTCFRISRSPDGALIERRTCEQTCSRELDGTRFSQGCTIM